MLSSVDPVGRGAIVLIGANAEVAQQVRANAGARPVVATRTREELSLNLARAPDLIVYDSRHTDADTAGRVAGFLSAVRSPLLLVTGCHLAETRALHRLCVARPDAYVDLDGAELGKFVSDLSAAPRRPTAAAAIVGAVSEELPGVLGAYRVVSALLSGKRATAAEICQRCECSMSAVDRVARVRGVPGPGQQNREHWALHVLYDAVVFGLPLKQIVAARGGGSVSALSHGVSGALGKPLRAWRRVGGFDAALADYAARWHSTA
jgi:hypothetical protein